MRAFERLVGFGCDRLVLLYVLKVIRHRLPSNWSGSTESRRARAARHSDAERLEQAARVIEDRFVMFLPRANDTDEDRGNLIAWDQLSFLGGSVSPARLLVGLRAAADQLRSPESFRQVAQLRANQIDFNVACRYVTCGYVRRSSGSWRDGEVAILLSQVGNFKADRRQSFLDATALKQWRAKNFERLDRTFSPAVEHLLSLAAV
jgi:hypothetical protein